LEDTTEEVFFKPLGQYADFINNKAYVGTEFPFYTENIKSETESFLEAQLCHINPKETTSRIIFFKQDNGYYSILITEDFNASCKNEENRTYNFIEFGIKNAAISYIGNYNGYYFFNISFNKAIIMGPFESSEKIKTFVRHNNIACPEITNSNANYFLKKYNEELNMLLNTLSEEINSPSYANIVFAIKKVGDTFYMYLPNLHLESRKILNPRDYKTNIYKLVESVSRDKDKMIHIASYKESFLKSLFSFFEKENILNIGELLINSSHLGGSILLIMTYYACYDSNN
jgi:hypothetical protein